MAGLSYRMTESVSHTGGSFYRTETSGNHTVEPSDHTVESNSRMQTSLSRTVESFYHTKSLLSGLETGQTLVILRVVWWGWWWKLRKSL
jgi:hypothetical protein